MKKTSKMTQPLPPPPVIPTPQAPEAPQELEPPQMQDVAAEEEQDESSDSSATPGEWVEPEDPHPPEKRPRRSSPDYDPAEELPKTYQRRRKRTRRVVSTGPSESQPSMGPSESEPEPRQKKGCKNKMPTKVRVVGEINRDGVPVKPDKIQGPATHACGCLAREAVCIIHDD